MIFDRREWLAIMSAGTAKLFGLPGEPMSELPDDDEQSFTSISIPGGQCDQCGLLQCDACGYHFYPRDLDQTPCRMALRMPGGNVWLCDDCAEHAQKAQILGFNLRLTERTT